MMKFLFETIAFRSDQPTYYRKYQVEDGKYYAEHVNEGSGRLAFFFGKKDDQWLADDPSNEDVCDQIGEEVDNYMRKQ